jgi:hypothetical protein
MKSIGGYFELELHSREHHYHDTPYRLKNGRAALYAILEFAKPTLVYVPYYTCDSMLEPFTAADIPFSFYEINARLEPKDLPRLKAGEYFLYVNYFGVKNEAVSELSKRYKDKLIIDATQAFFLMGKGAYWLFNSCRKFFGVPDGAYLYTPASVDLPVVVAKNEQYITDHLLKRFQGQTQEGYAYFQKNEALMDCDIVGMSALSEQLLSGVDYGYATEKRLENYQILGEAFKSVNLHDDAFSNLGVPMCYPLLLDRKVDKNKLIAGNIFIPAFWNEVLVRETQGFEFEKQFTQRLLPLPIDHRYTTEDMTYLVKALKTIL